MFYMQFLDILGKGKQIKEREEGSSEKKVGGGPEDSVCDSLNDFGLHEVQVGSTHPTGMLSSLTFQVST